MHLCYLQFSSVFGSLWSLSGSVSLPSCVGAAQSSVVCGCCPYLSMRVTKLTALVGLTSVGLILLWVNRHVGKGAIDIEGTLFPESDLFLQQDRMDIVNKRTYFGAELSGLEFQLCHLLSV